MTTSSSSGPGPGPLPASTIVGRLANGGPAVVAMSGGVDSSVVAWLAHRALGEKSVALTLTGPAVSSDEVETAARVAEQIGIRHFLLRSDPLADSRYAENPSNRCYFCRNHEGTLIREWGQKHSYEVFLDGVQRDDFGDDRPGLRAMDEHGFRHPLAEAGWNKAEVRGFAHRAGLPNWNRPSNACLASRITHGQLITAPMLEKVAQAEAWVSSRGYRRVRVRVVGDSARVEVDPDEVENLQSEATGLREALARLGFATVEIDPSGYRPRANA
jgi:pyridinium-3,5-biscarboxylic acid mononucleotide sulfurtransferase